MLKAGILLFSGLFTGTLHAQSADFQIYGKSISEIRQSMKMPHVLLHRAFTPALFPLHPAATCSTDAPAEIPLFFTAGLSRWKPADLPFFCRIEHELGKKLPVQFKFRLGSVEYVDALEGK